MWVFNRKGEPDEDKPVPTSLTQDERLDALERDFKLLAAEVQIIKKKVITPVVQKSGTTVDER